jgi:hypothetical protein
MRSMFAAGVAGAAAFIFVGKAFALGPAACEIYTKIAVDQANEERALNCGWDKNPNDPRWDNKPEGHKRWCRGVADGGTTYAELAKREIDLQRCRLCNAYATEAMAAVKKNIELHCGLERGNPARWQNDYGAHFHWCMGLSSITATSEPLLVATFEEGGERTQELGKCEVRQKRDALTAQPKSTGRAKPFTPAPRKRSVKVPCEPGTGVASGPCGTASPSKVLGPGLLEGDGGFARQGPAGTRTLSAPTGGGRSLGGSTYSSPH